MPASIKRFALCQAGRDRLKSVIHSAIINPHNRKRDVKIFTVICTACLFTELFSLLTSLSLSTSRFPPLPPSPYVYCVDLSCSPILAQRFQPCKYTVAFVRIASSSLHYIHHCLLPPSSSPPTHTYTKPTSSCSTILPSMSFCWEPSNLPPLPSQPPYPQSTITV